MLLFLGVLLYVVTYPCAVVVVDAVLVVVVVVSVSRNMKMVSLLTFN